jgi:transposase
MNQYAALNVSLEQTASCVVDESGRKLCEGRVATCPDAVASWLAEKATGLMRLGMETGPLAVWLWNELSTRGLPIDVTSPARSVGTGMSQSVATG